MIDVQPDPVILDGFILAGGASRRMGRDKALLPYGGATLIESVAASIQPFARAITVIGPPERYRDLGLPVLADRRPGCGPLAGLETALAASETPWLWVVACDMPLIRPDVLKAIANGVRGGLEAVWPRTPDGRLHPLCAAYHKSAATAVSRALDQGRFKVRDAFDPAAIAIVDVAELFNVNTPEDLAQISLERPPSPR
jgi:molybdopterin-guanine dinucleotide biosynthesis protein A